MQTPALHHIPRLVLLLVLLLAAQGCRYTDPVDQQTGMDPPDQLPAYADIVARFNDNAARVTHLWARADVEFVWYEDGRRRTEVGDDSRLILRLPDELALDIAKPFDIRLFWLGSNSGRYWLFDDISDTKRVYYGSHANFTATGWRGFPIPVHPLELPALLGVLPIDPSALPREPTVEWAAGGYLIEPPGTATRLVIDPRTYLPLRVDLLDRYGNSAIIARLSRPEAVAPGDQPLVNKHVAITVVGQPGHITLKLRDMTSDASRFNERQFDLDFLMKVRKPDERIDLDATD